MITIKGLLDEDFINYKKPSMVIMFPVCSWKCDKECGLQVCQNSKLANSPDIEISEQKIVERYKNNTISQALVCAGLEPIDSFPDLLKLIKEFRKNTDDDIVIYTGYTEDEIEEKNILPQLSEYNNIIMKYGRFIPNSKSHFDDGLGIRLASENQYSKILTY